MANFRLGRFSHKKWLARYNERVEPLENRLRKLPEEYQRPWWAPHCPEEPPMPKWEEGVEVWPWWVPDPPSFVRKVITPRGLGYKWKGFLVDGDLHPEWLEELNSLPNVEITSTNAGHASPYGMHYPGIEIVIVHPEVKGGNGEGDRVHELVQEDFHDLAEAVAWEVHPRGAGGYAGAEGRIVVFLYSWVPREWMSLCEYISWWEQIIERLKVWTKDLPEMTFD